MPKYNTEATKSNGIQNPAAVTREVPEALLRLNTNVSYLSDQINTLIDRLTPVLPTLHEESVSDSTSPAYHYDTQLGSEIGSAAVNVDHLAVRLQGVLNYLAI